MTKIIQDNQIAEDPYFVVTDKEMTDTDTISDEKAILPFSIWKQNQDQMPAENNRVWLDSDEPSELLAEDIEKFSLIAINFPAFTDGRGYSYAFKLRDHYHYKGTIRAIGDVLLDQLTALRRVGFDSFSLREDQDLNEALKHFNDFESPYQASVEPKEPLFRKLSS